MRILKLFFAFALLFCGWVVSIFSALALLMGGCTFAVFRSTDGTEFMTLATLTLMGGWILLFLGGFFLDRVRKAKKLDITDTFEEKS